MMCRLRLSARPLSCGAMWRLEGTVLRGAHVVTGATGTATRQGNRGNVLIVGQAAIYDADSATGRDLFSIDLSRPNANPSQLTRTGQVANPEVGGGFAVWQQPAQGDPMSVWALNLGRPGARPFALLSGANEGNAIAGDGFAAYLNTDDALVVVPLDHTRGREQVVVPAAANLSIISRWAASGSLLTWVTGKRGATQTIHVTQVG